MDANINQDDEKLKFFQASSPVDNNGLAGQLESRMQQMAMKYQPGAIEFEGYFIGDRDEVLTHFVLPNYVMGVNLDREDKIKLDEVTDISSRTNTFLAVRRDTGELGIQVIASKEGAPQDKAQFFSFGLLVLNQQLSHFLPDQMVRNVFPGVERGQISNTMLADAVKRDRNVLSHTYFEDDRPDFTVDYLPTSLFVDMFGAKRSLHPTNKFMVDVLLRNKFDGGGTFGLSHIHYGYTPREIEQSRRLKELRRFDESFVRLITPEDAVQIISSELNIRVLSKGRLDNTGIGLLGVTALDPVNFNIIGSSYFDFLELSKDENEQDFAKFGRLAILAKNSSDTAVSIDFFSFVREYSPPSLPDYVVSINEDIASSPVSF